MKILLTNDDGIHADGIFYLQKELKRLGQLTIIAPDSERSSISHAITLEEPVYVSKHKRNGRFFGYGLSGTPSDCVKFGINQIYKKKPDIVVSGINRGSNEGCSVIYSGTVAGAREGALLGIPSFAISLNTYVNPEFGYAAKIAVKIIRQILKARISPKTFFNINVPHLPKSKIKGVRFTRQCMVPIHGTFTKRKDPNGNPYYWLSGKIPFKSKNLNVDAYALSQNYVTVTPVHCDTTDYEALEQIQNLRISR